jgi:hypothetical protein
MKFCRQDENNAYEVLWTRSEQGRAELELRKTVGGKTVVLDRKDVSFLPAFWVELAVRQREGAIAVFVDGRPVLRAVDAAPLLGGGIGLWSKGGKGTVFDDVEVAPAGSMTFAMGEPETLPRRLLSGLPADREAFSREGLLVKENAPCELTIAGMMMKNAAVTASVSGLSARQGKLELVVRRSGSEQAVFRLERTDGEWRAVLLQQRADGERELDARTIESLPDTAEIACRVIGSEIWGTINGMTVVLSGKLAIAEQGLCAVSLQSTNGVLTLRSLGVEPEIPLPLIENRVETFTHEESMRNWNSPVLEWTMQYGAPWPLYWHCSDFWQDVGVSMDVKSLEAAARADAWGLALGVPNAGDDNVKTRAALIYDPAARKVRFEAGGNDPLMLDRGAGVRRLTLTRRAGRLLAHVDAVLIWSVPLPSDLRELCRAGRIGRGSTVAWADAVEIRALGVRTYSFKRAPTAWVPAAGTWKVTNRWQCDPRWSFFSGVKRHGVACIWNKGQHGGDVTLEFFAGPKMDRERGRRYEYAANLNAVICADGADITSGYSFLFGGWDDRGSQIVRGKTILNENRKMPIPRHSSIHRRWFHLKIRKHGNRLTYWIDGARVASVEDPRPLAGNRFGLWTWDNGMMVAQARISTTTALPAAPLDNTPPKTPESPYD